MYLSGGGMHMAPPGAHAYARHPEPAQRILPLLGAASTPPPPPPPPSSQLLTHQLPTGAFVIQVPPRRTKPPSTIGTSVRRAPPPPVSAVGVGLTSPVGGVGGSVGPFGSGQVDATTRRRTARISGGHARYPSACAQAIAARKHNPLECERCWRADPIGLQKLLEEQQRGGGGGDAAAAFIAANNSNGHSAQTMVTSGSQSGLLIPTAPRDARSRKVYYLPIKHNPSTKRFGPAHDAHAAPTTMVPSSSVHHLQMQGRCTCAQCLAHTSAMACPCWQCTGVQPPASHATQYHWYSMQPLNLSDIQVALRRHVHAFLADPACALLDDRCKAQLSDPDPARQAFVAAELDRLCECGTLSPHYLHTMNLARVAALSATKEPKPPVPPSFATLDALIAAQHHLCLSTHLRSRILILEFLRKSSWLLRVGVGGASGSAWSLADVDRIMVESELYERVHEALLFYNDLARATPPPGAESHIINDTGMANETAEKLILLLRRYRIDIRRRRAAEASGISTPQSPTQIYHIRPRGGGSPAPTTPLKIASPPLEDQMSLLTLRSPQSQPSTTASSQSYHTPVAPKSSSRSAGSVAPHRTRNGDSSVTASASGGDSSARQREDRSDDSDLRGEAADDHDHQPVQLFTIAKRASGGANRATNMSLPSIAHHLLRAYLFGPRCRLLSVRMVALERQLSDDAIADDSSNAPRSLFTEQHAAELLAEVRLTDSPHVQDAIKAEELIRALDRCQQEAGARESCDTVEQLIALVKQYYQRLKPPPSAPVSPVAPTPRRPDTITIKRLRSRPGTSSSRSSSSRILNSESQEEKEVLIFSPARSPKLPSIHGGSTPPPLDAITVRRVVSIPLPVPPPVPVSTQARPQIPVPVPPPESRPATLRIQSSRRAVEAVDTPSKPSSPALATVDAVTFVNVPKPPQSRVVSLTRATSAPVPSPAVPLVPLDATSLPDALSGRPELDRAETEESIATTESESSPSVPGSPSKEEVFLTLRPGVPRTTVLRFTGGRVTADGEDATAYDAELAAVLDQVRHSDVTISSGDGLLSVSHADRMGIVTFLSTLSLFDAGTASFMEVSSDDFDGLIRAAGGDAALKSLLRALDQAGARFSAFHELLPAVMEAVTTGLYVSATTRGQLNAWLASEESSFRVAHTKLLACADEEWEAMVVSCSGVARLRAVLNRLEANGRTSYETVGDLSQSIALERVALDHEEVRAETEREERMDRAREQLMVFLSSNECGLFCETRADELQVLSDDIDQLLTLACPTNTLEPNAPPPEPEALLTAALHHLARFDRLQRRFLSFAQLTNAMETACGGHAATAEDALLLFNMDPVNLQRTHATRAARDAVTRFLTHPNCMLLLEPETALQRAEPRQWDHLVELLLEAHPLTQTVILEEDSVELVRIAGGLDGMDAAAIVHHLVRLERRGHPSCATVDDLLAALRTMHDRLQIHAVPVSAKQNLLDRLVDLDLCAIFSPEHLAEAGQCDEAQLEDIFYALLGDARAATLCTASSEEVDAAFEATWSRILVASSLVSRGERTPGRIFDDIFPLIAPKSLTAAGGGGIGEERVRVSPAEQEKQREISDYLTDPACRLFSECIAPPVLGERDLHALCRKDTSVFVAPSHGHSFDVVASLRMFDSVSRKFDSSVELLAALDELANDEATAAHDPDAVTASAVASQVRMRIDALLLRADRRVLADPLTPAVEVLPRGHQYDQLVRVCGGPYAVRSHLDAVHRASRQFATVSALIEFIRSSSGVVTPATESDAHQWDTWLSEGATREQLLGAASKTPTPAQLGALIQAAGGDVHLLTTAALKFIAVGHVFTGPQAYAAMLAALQTAATEGYHVSDDARSEVFAYLGTSASGHGIDLHAACGLFRKTSKPVSLSPHMLDDLLASGRSAARLVASLAYLDATGRTYDGLNLRLLTRVRLMHTHWTVVSIAEKQLVLNYLMSDKCHLWDTRKRRQQEQERNHAASHQGDDDTLVIDNALLEGLIHECQPYSSASPSPSAASSLSAAGCCISELRSLELYGCEFDNFPDLVATVATAKDLAHSPVGLAERRRVIEYLAQPSTRIFTHRTNRLTLSGHEVDIALIRGGGLAQLLVRLQQLNAEGRVFTNFPQLLSAVATTSNTHAHEDGQQHTAHDTEERQ